MGHDICGFNKNNEEIAYARYSMGNQNARLLYKVFDSDNHDGGVSGDGTDKDFTFQQMKMVFVNFKKLKESDFSEDYEAGYEYTKLSDFICDCLEVAEQEGKVRVGFY